MGTKLYVIPGHGQGDSGAVGGGYTEADLVRQLATRIKEMGGAEVETSDFALNCYENDGMLNWSFPDGAQVVELHMDSADVPARGAHVIYKEGYTPDAYDTALAERLSAMMPGRANILVGRSDLQNVNQAAMRGIPYRLVENGFISDATDRAYFIEHIDDIARVYLDVFGISQSGDAYDDNVAYMQTVSEPMCQRAEIDAPAVTGLWDVQTQRALVHLAQVQMLAEMDPTLTPSGEIGAQSRAIMDARPVSEGDAGLASWAVKAALVGHGYIGSEVDGEWYGTDLSDWTFKAEDAAALERFQADNPPLEVSGKADASTWCTLCPNCYSDESGR